ncbi:MAG: MFS transporter [Chloroflexota bacterium]
MVKGRGVTGIAKIVPKRRKIFYGWWMVLATAVLYFFSGGTFYYGFTVFFNPIRETFGWNAAVTSIAFVFQRLEQGVMGPVAGFLVDRVGPRKLMVPGWILAGLGFFLMSRINMLWGFYGAFLIIATGMSFGRSVVTDTAIANWFVKKRSRALTFIYLGMGLSGLLVPLLALFITNYGWRAALIIVSIGTFIVGVPLSLVMRHKPGQYGYFPDGAVAVEASTDLEVADKRAKQEAAESARSFTVKEALRTRAFWLLSFVFFFQHIGTSAIMVHIVPYLENVKVPTAIAATAVTGMTLCSLIGRLAFGLLGDFANKRYLLTAALALQTAGIFIFSLVDQDRIWLVIPFLLIYAPGYGGTIPLRPALQADYFGTNNFGTIMGLMSIIGMAAGLASPVVAGWIFDVTGSYHLAWRLFALVTLPAIPLMLLTIPPKPKTDKAVVGTSY